MNFDEIYYSVIIASLILGIALMYFFISVIRQRKHNLQLQRQNIIIKTDTIEEERSRIANDLHDEIAPFVNMIKMRIDNSRSKKQKEEIKKDIGELLSRVREVTFDLMPEYLLRRGLSSTLKYLGDHVYKKYQIETGLSIEEEIQLTEQQTLHIFRIIQEIVHNAIKHSSPTTLHIALRRRDEKVILNVIDDGTGFDYYAALKDTKGFGLRSIQSRAQLLHAEMFVQSQKTAGTHYAFEIPLRETE